MEDNFETEIVEEDEDTGYMVPVETEEVEESSDSCLGTVLLCAGSAVIGAAAHWAYGKIRHAFSEEGKAEREIRKEARRQKKLAKLTKPEDEEAEVEETSEKETKTKK